MNIHDGEENQETIKLLSQAVHDRDLKIEDLQGKLATASK